MLQAAATMVSCVIGSEVNLLASLRTLSDLI